MHSLINGAYNNCSRCRLCEQRKNIVFGHGDIPAKLFIIGEAPGETEDFLGTPFSGESGNLLHNAILQAEQRAGYKPSIFISNIVACRPPQNRVPFPDESKACDERLNFELEKVNPEVVMLLGSTAKRLFKKKNDYEIITLVHPAFITRDGGFESSYYLKFRQVFTDVFLRLKK